jgi:predicted MFS family arabinose efflux permease
MVSGAFWTIDMPVRRRLLVDSVGQDRLPKALGFDNSTNYATRALGPLIGGGAYQVLGIGGIYALIATAYLACFVMAWRLGGGAPRARAADTAGGWLATLKVPKELVFNRRFAVIMGVTFVYNVTCFPFSTMVPVIAQKDFALAPAYVGMLSACDGIGGTLGAILVGAFASERTLFRFYFFGVTTILGLILALSFHLTVEATVVMLLFSGMAAAGFSATQYALVHVISPPEVRGRATGVLSLFIGSSMLGHWVAGQLFGQFTSPEAMRITALFGLSCMAVLGAFWWGKR